MKFFLSVFLLLWVFGAFGSAFAATSSQVNLSGDLGGTATVSTNGGNISSTINADTGALSTAFTPVFQMSSNDPLQKNLTLKVEAMTTSGYQNAVFNIGTTKYVILTNVAYPPNVSSLNNIKTGSPTAENNPNAIAYVANDPTSSTGNITITYQSIPKNWNLLLTSNGIARATFTIPAGNPFTNTFSSDDEAGSYQAVVTLSFNP